MPIRGAVYVNGTITPAEEAVIPVYDHGFLYGEGVYETLRTYNRRSVPLRPPRAPPARVGRRTSRSTCRSATTTLRGVDRRHGRGRRRDATRPTSACC